MATGKKGDFEAVTTAQSVSKVVNEAVVRTLYGETYSKLVGSEFSNSGYNDVHIDGWHRPVNGMINFGAIANGILLHDFLSKQDQNTEAYLLNTWQQVTGRSMAVNEAVYDEDKTCRQRGEYDAHLQAFQGETSAGKHLQNSWRKNGVVLTQSKIDAGLDLFLRLCSLAVNAEDLAKLGLVLENRGVNPLTKNTIFSSTVAEAVSGSMRSGGMYGATEEIAEKTNDISCKSGISGALIAHRADREPLFAFGLYGPRLSEHGNSVQGVKVLEVFTREFSHN